MGKEGRKKQHVPWKISKRQMGGPVVGKTMKVSGRIQLLVILGDCLRKGE